MSDNTVYRIEKNGGVTALKNYKKISSSSSGTTVSESIYNDSAKHILDPAGTDISNKSIQEILSYIFKAQENFGKSTSSSGLKTSGSKKKSSSKSTSIYAKLVKGASSIGEIVKKYRRKKITGQVHKIQNFRNYSDSFINILKNINHKK